MNKETLRAVLQTQTFRTWTEDEIHRLWTQIMRLSVGMPPGTTVQIHMDPFTGDAAIVANAPDPKLN